jgi:hypothetical protein
MPLNDFLDFTPYSDHLHRIYIMDYICLDSVVPGAKVATYLENLVDMVDLIVAITGRPVPSAKKILNRNSPKGLFIQLDNSAKVMHFKDAIEFAKSISSPLSPSQCADILIIVDAYFSSKVDMKISKTNTDSSSSDPVKKKLKTGSELQVVEKRDLWTEELKHMKIKYDLELQHIKDIAQAKLEAEMHLIQPNLFLRNDQYNVVHALPCGFHMLIMHEGGRALAKDDFAPLEIIACDSVPLDKFWISLVTLRCIQTFLRMQLDFEYFKTTDIVKGSVWVESWVAEEHCKEKECLGFNLYVYNLHFGNSDADKRIKYYAMTRTGSTNYIRMYRILE